jgi:hypothetical protein
VGRPDLAGRLADLAHAVALLDAVGDQALDLVGGFVRCQRLGLAPRAAVVGEAGRPGFEEVAFSGYQEAALAEPMGVSDPDAEPPWSACGPRPAQCALPNRRAERRGHDAELHRHLRKEASIPGEHTSPTPEARMAHNNKEQQAPRVIWRISQAHPEGVYLTTADHPVKPTTSPLAYEIGYRGSSHELQQGVDVTEVSSDSLPEG